MSGCIVKTENEDRITLLNAATSGYWSLLRDPLANLSKLDVSELEGVAPLFALIEWTVSLAAYTVCSALV
jgi:hypothetical protein